MQKLFQASLPVMGVIMVCAQVLLKMQALPSPSLLNGSKDQQTVQSQDRNDLMDRSMALSLANIRGSLIRQEDTIIFSLIERSQFSLNAPVYNEGDLSVQAL